MAAATPQEHRPAPPSGGRRTWRRLRRLLRALSRPDDVERLAHQAFHDALTGLPNRALLEDRMAQAFARAGRQRTTVALLFFDLDGFKAVNDTHGHAAGDDLLAGVARRLQSAVRPMDTVARLGGDEFTVLLEQLADPSDAVRLAERISASLAEPFELAGETVHVGASVGVAYARDGHAEPGELLREADLAMYRAKQRGRGSVEIFDPALQVRRMRRREIGDALRRALDRADVALRYEPQVATGTGKVVAVEGAARWESPTGLLLADDLAATATELGLAGPLAAKAISEACSRGAHWAQLGDEPLPVGVDVAEEQLRDATLVPAVAAALQRTGLPPELLRLEIAEDAIAADPVAGLAVVRQLRALGATIVLDHVGRGPSAFNLLPQLPVDEVKVEARAPDPLVRGVLATCAQLRIRVTAGGVDTPRRLAELEALGVAAVQGSAVRAGVDADAVPASFRRRRAARSLQADAALPLRRRSDGAGRAAETPRSA